MDESAAPELEGEVAQIYDESQQLDEALSDMISRAERNCDLASLPAAWHAPMAELARDLAALDPDYQLGELAWGNRGLRISVVWQHLACCSDPEVGWEHHLDNETPEHKTERAALDARNEQLFDRCLQARHQSPHWGEPPRSAAADPRPVVALDIDGVINPVPPQPLHVIDIDGAPHAVVAGMLIPIPGSHQEPVVRDLPTATIDIPEGTSRNPFFAGASRDVTITVRYDPVVIDWVRELHTRAEVVWATTWEAAANLLAVAIGLPPAPVGISAETNAPRFGYYRGGDAAGWKGEALAKTYDNRPLVWVDDLAGGHKWDLSWRHPDDVGKTLVLVPEAHIGITAEHMAAVDAFVSHWAQPTVS